MSMQWCVYVFLVFPANSQGGFQPEQWGLEWRSLPDASKKEYEQKALAERAKNIDVKSIFKNINSMFTLLKENKEAVKSSGIEGVCLIVSKTDSPYFTEFGSLKGISKMPSFINSIMKHSAGKLDNVKRACIQDLRDKVIAKMSKIAKSELGLNQFPYERVKKGEFIIQGIPPSLLPLKPPGRMTSKELMQVLDCTVTVTRVAEGPSAVDVMQAPVVADSFVASDPPACQVAPNMLVQDIFVASDPPASQVAPNMLVQDIFVASDPPACQVAPNMLVQDIFVASDPPACQVAPNMLVQDIFVASDPPASPVAPNMLVQDMEEAPTSTLQLSTVMKKSAKQHQESREKSQRTGIKSLWTAAEILVVQQHFSQELAGLKPVTRSSIDSFLAQQTVVKRTATALGNYLLRNRKKIRPNDQ
ncbi:uncharacterized protein LOC112556039 isoform X2 [Pomacea canaliculata]|uniref:uncharacterized protein LOC112556039 isoform X2 n=1 Tax=Pomacea canaliculata TaxID=400727 RepID=UPI000D73013E|nr:uncharacterized protein LOC112556039 isoform X2 [Pomacea canaliculata]